MNRDGLTTGMEVVGALCIVAAAWLIYLPLGLFVAGLFLLLFGWLGGR